MAESATLEKSYSRKGIKGSNPFASVKTKMILINDKHRAFKFEKYLKSGSGRAFINKHLKNQGNSDN